MTFHSHANKTHFQMKSCALGLALKKRHKTTRKWPIRVCSGFASGFGFPSLCDWLKTYANCNLLARVPPALMLVFALSSDWFTQAVLFGSVAIGLSNYFWFWSVTTLN